MPSVLRINVRDLLERRRIESKRILDEMPELLSAQEDIEAAVAERRAGREDRAHEHFVRAGEAVFEDVRALHEFAQCKLRLTAGLSGRRDPRDQEARRAILLEARDLLQRVLQMDAPPTRHGWAWFDLGRVRRWLGEAPTSMREAFEEAARLCPGEERFQRELLRAREGD